jgi:hypothetical protein
MPRDYSHFLTRVAVSRPYYYVMIWCKIRMAFTRLIVPRSDNFVMIILLGSDLVLLKCVRFSQKTVLNHGINASNY